MRKTRMLLSACLALLASATLGARAEDGGADDFIQRLFAAKSIEHKTFACFVRRYDARHLPQHPRQKVSAMKLLVLVDKPEESTEPRYGFRLGVNFRKRPAGDFQTSGDCGLPQAEVAGKTLRIHCSVDCDGGGVAIGLADGDKSVNVKLDEIHIYPAVAPAKAGDDDGDLMLEGGSDDRLFRLDRTDIAQCDQLAVDADELAAMHAK